MDAVKRWAIIEDNKVINLILADEEFITSQGFNAVQDDLATVGLDLDEDGNILYPEVALPQPEEIPLEETIEEPVTE